MERPDIASSDTRNFLKDLASRLGEINEGIERYLNEIDMIARIIYVVADDE